MNSDLMMSDKERLIKLDTAIRLIREVEFSYPQRDPERMELYKFVVNNFSLIGAFMVTYDRIKKRAELE